MPARLPAPLEVKELFDELAWTIVQAGWQRYSARAILHRIRWHYHIEKGQREFKCNDHWTPDLARDWLRRHPNHPHFFEIRERRPIDTSAYDVVEQVEQQEASP